MAKKEKKTKKENNKNKKSFFKDFKAELKKVNWPTPKQLLNNTIAVITIVFITAAIVFVLDVVFETLNKQGVNKIKEIITTTEDTADDISTQDTLTDNETTDEVLIEGEESTSTVEVEESTETIDEENDTENNAE